MTGSRLRQEHAEVDSEAFRSIILLPTYQERNNLARLLPEILQFTRADVLVLDDLSPDGTGQLADSFARTSSRVRVLHRDGPRGLGHAYRDGFRQALAGGYGRIVTMDADGSHSPAKLPELIELCDRYDLVLGTRWTTGGSTQGWSLPRRLLSRTGCWYARSVLGVSVRDLTSGFKCYRRELVKQLDLRSTSSTGYAFQIETTYRAIRAGFTVVETPIRFVERQHGNSKMTWSIALEAAIAVLLMRRRAIQEGRSI